MNHHVDYATTENELLLHTDQESAARKAAELWVDYDLKRLDEMRAVERSADYHAATYGKVGFRHVDRAGSQPFGDIRLNERLVMLCENLRARY